LLLSNFVIPAIHALREESGILSISNSDSGQARMTGYFIVNIDL